MRRQYLKTLRRLRETLSRKAVSLVISAAILASLFSVGATNANGRIREWVGGDNNDSNWTSNGNWNGIGGGGQNDDLVFGSQVLVFGGLAYTVPVRRANTNDLAVNTSFDSMTFNGFNYVISGNQIFLKKGLTIDLASGFSGNPVFNPNIIFASVAGLSQTWTSKSGSTTFNGVVNLNGRNWVVNTELGGSVVLNGLVNGFGTLFKNGVGSLLIHGNGGSLGNTILNAGTLEVSGNSAVLGDITLNGGTLSGNGRLGNIFGGNSGAIGTISPGTPDVPVGQLRTIGLVSLNSNTTFAADLTSPGSTDQLFVQNNNVDLNNANLDISLGFTPTVGQQFLIIRHTGTGAITGQFDQGTGIVDNGQLFRITYTVNSVLLTALGPVTP